MARRSSKVKKAAKAVLRAIGKCFKCQAPCTANQWCFGCKVYICDTCDTHNPTLPMPHEPKNHLEPWDEEEPRWERKLQL